MALVGPPYIYIYICVCVCVCDISTRRVKHPVPRDLRVTLYIVPPTTGKDTRGPSKATNAIHSLDNKSKPTAQISNYYISALVGPLNMQPARILRRHAKQLVKQTREAADGTWLGAEGASVGEIYRSRGFNRNSLSHQTVIPLFMGENRIDIST
jgi:hypothetical protein